MEESIAVALVNLAFLVLAADVQIMHVLHLLAKANASFQILII
jgi:hypothetical protein